MQKEKSNIYKKIKIIFFIVLITITTLGIAGYLDYKKSTTSTLEQQKCTPTTTDPIANWKIYTSEEYKFTIKYPKEWVFTKSDISEIPSNVIGMIPYAITLAYPNDNENCFSQIFINPEGGAASAYEDPSSEITSTKTKIGELNIKKFSKGNYTEYTDFGNIKFSKFAIIIINFQPNKNTIEKILSTFKFTN